MRILYLSKNVNSYKSANYQKEFLDALSRIASIYICGPGYSNFDKKKKITDIINQHGPFNFIFVGHLWLDDSNMENIDPWPNSGLSDILHKKFIFLNKEYANLNKKLKWIKMNKFNCVFSHHQNCKIWENKIKIKFKYLPFAYNEKLFNYSKNNKKYDLAFSGVLQNTRGNKVQSDIRIRILNRIYYTIFDIPLIKKKKYRNMSIFWNSVPTNFIGYILSKIFNIYKFLNIKSYAKVQKNSRLYLNCKSPLNLISPRYFENVASGCLVITEKNKELKKILPKFSYVEFSNDLSDFDHAMYKALNFYKSSEKKRIYNAKIMKKKHSWDIRARMTLKIIKRYL